VARAAMPAPCRAPPRRKHGGWGHASDALGRHQENNKTARDVAGLGGLGVDVTRRNGNSGILELGPARQRMRTWPARRLHQRYAACGWRSSDCSRAQIKFGGPSAGPKLPCHVMSPGSRLSLLPLQSAALATWRLCSSSGVCMPGASDGRARRAEE
jgi:hypothetical protein